MTTTVAEPTLETEPAPPATPCYACAILAPEAKVSADVLVRISHNDGSDDILGLCWACLVRWRQHDAKVVIIRRLQGA